MRFGMNRTALSLALPFLVALATPAFAWGTDTSTSDPSTTSQFTDPDEALDNLANPAAANGGTELSVQTDGSGSAHTITTAPDPADAEPVNPAWPMWMQWHQQ